MSKSTKSAFVEGQTALEELVDQGVSKTHLARSHVLRLLSGGLLGAAISIFLPAGKASGHAAPCPDPFPCYGFPCAPWFNACCRSDLLFCDPHCDGGYYGCPSGGLCWYVCHVGVRYKCCDCKCYACNIYICRFVVGTC